MRTHLSRWLPTVIATLALVVALDAPSTAKKLIGGRDIKKGAVASKHLKNNGVQGIDVRDGSLAGADVLDGSLAGADVLDGSLAGADVLDGSLAGGDVNDGSLTGADLANASVGQADLSSGAVGTGQLARNAVRGPTLDAAGNIALDFPTITAHTCHNQSVSIAAGSIADGTLQNDVMMMTPDAFFAFNFSWTVKTEAPTIAIIKMCNIGTTNVDPDAGGSNKRWDYIAINSS